MLSDLFLIRILKSKKVGESYKSSAYHLKFYKYNNMQDQLLGATAFAQTYFHGTKADLQLGDVKPVIPPIMAQARKPSTFSYLQHWMLLFGEQS